ncbi:MAG: glycosyltransferase [Caulobacterales bacterium]
MAPDDGSAFNHAFARAMENARESFTCVDPLSVHAPERSAKHGISAAQWAALLTFVSSLIIAAVLAPALTATLSACVFAALIMLRVAAAFMPSIKADSEPCGALPTYSILCPVYREAAALPGLIAALDRLHYPRALLDVLILVEADDAETRRVADAFAARRSWVRVVESPLDGPRTKPKALNAGLAIARGDLLTVYDAEDRPHPDQLLTAVAAFQAGGAELACVQAPLRAYNGGERWVAGQFALEYAVQFGLLLPLFVKLGWPILLGGTSNHFRTRTLKNVHGWDSYNVTEDADLGLRLARQGSRVGLIAPPTFEEAPISLKAWRRQRTRWIKGHLMTWLVHMRRPSAMLRDLGWPRFIGAQLSLGGGLLSSFAHAPFLFGVLWLSLSGADMQSALALALIGYGASLLCAMRVAATERQSRFLLRGVLAPFYWPLQSWAAFLALRELIRAPHVWAKTEHGLTSCCAPAIGDPLTNPLNIAAE